MATRQPLPRAWHAAVGVGSKLYVWGGKSDPAIRTASLDIFDVPAMKWKEPQVLRGSAVMPSELHSMAVTTDGETSYTFGGTAGVRGSSSKTYYNTVFQVTPSQRVCQELQPTSPSRMAPEKAVDSCIVQYQDKLVLHGGYTGQKRTKELYLFDLRESECEFWYQIYIFNTGV